MIFFQNIAIYLNSSILFHVRIGLKLEFFPENFLVEVRLMATGDAPIMKQKNYKVDQEKKVEWIIAFIRKYLKLEDAESLVRIFLFF